MSNMINRASKRQALWQTKRNASWCALNFHMIGYKCILPSYAGDPALLKPGYEFEHGNWLVRVLTRKPAMDDLGKAYHVTHVEIIDYAAHMKPPKGDT